MFSFRQKDVNMLSGSILKGLLQVSVPIMIMNVIQALFNIVDMTILKSYDTDGGIAVGAVGACGTLIATITSLIVGAASGANVVIAKGIGSKDSAGVERSVATSCAVSLAGGVLIAVVGVIFARVFLLWTNCPKELLDDAVLYFSLYFAGVPILIVYNFCAAMMRATGDSGRPMLFLTAGGVVKIATNYMFVAKFGMGVKGVAFATILSWGVSASLGLFSLIFSEGAVRIEPKKIRFCCKELKEILRIGIPAGLQQALYSVANLIIFATVNSFGAKATTGISIANNFDNVLYQICTASGLAVMPYVSQNVGAKNIGRATASVKQGILVTVSLGVFFGSLSAIFSPQLASIMSNDPEVIAFARMKMIIISSTYFICGINEIFGAALRGMGYPLQPTVCTLIYMFVLRFIWVFFIFPLCPNLTFLYLVWPVGWILSIVTLLFVYVPAVKKHKNAVLEGK